ncbi:manganese-transporting P-type ATPase [Pancytospora philotis]|nr:manganese-transporting P-type ATPase [Pancytospora philotis]KAI4291111.1 manganese-transporting P-type ATPase [Pancytospora philotis]
MEEDYPRYTPVALARHAYLYPIYCAPVAYALLRDAKIVLIFSLIFSGVLYLSTFWAVKSLLVQCYRRDTKGRYLLYNGELCLLTREHSNGAEHCTFMHQRSKHLLVPGTGARAKAAEAVKILPKLDFPCRLYRAPVEQPFYGLFPANSIRIPRPTFLGLFKEQCVTPLFCFQVFSSLLLCFDNYVMQSLFSTCMIVAVEAALVLSRVSMIAQYRVLENKSLEITRIKERTGSSAADLAASLATCDAEACDSAALRPGDLVLIDRPIEMPCDAVLLEGSCAVDEAMLSGESVPLPKEALPNDESIFDIKKHKKHVLFAGTRIEKVQSKLYCRVLRTAFDTEQGALLNKMLCSEDIKYDPEALRFILILSVLSLGGTFYTWMYSKKTGYPLFIDLIVLFTNSIPFELPMEMGVAVQRAVKDLAMKKIHCLEPFRITLAGKVDVCCFDKTGTLTDSKLTLSKILHSGELTETVLHTCHGLVEIGGELRGDPLDLAVHKHLLAAASAPASGLVVHKRFPFSSEAKRQAVVAELPDCQRIFAVKGAPEVLERLLKMVPAEYADYRKQAAQGNRVVALAYRMLRGNERLDAQQSSYEKDLLFGGFLLFGSTLKAHAVEMCRTLEDAGHRIVMITGDNLLTAQNIARQLGISEAGAEAGEIDELLATEDPAAFFAKRIFARADPKHKEQIIRKYKAAGSCVMMVGDGTNDVGALKAADVGIAMLEGLPEQPAKKAAPKPGLDGVYQAFADPAQIKPGDASVAAPFTTRSNSLCSIVEIIQQGRSSLVTTIQMYKILALNSIINAFSYSFTDILGLKSSEYQMLALGLLSAMAFQAISSGRPLPSISRQRPITTIFSKYILGSILSQSVVHIIALLLLARWLPTPEFATEFKPSLMNTAVFALSATQTVSTLTCNYIGRPFRENISENTLMVVSITGLLAFVANILFGFHADINAMLEIVSLEGHTIALALIIAGDSIFSYAAEKLFFHLFMLK